MISTWQIAVTTISLVAEQM